MKKCRIQRSYVLGAYSFWNLWGSTSQNSQNADRTFEFSAHKFLWVLLDCVSWSLKYWQWQNKWKNKTRFGKSDTRGSQSLLHFVYPLKISNPFYPKNPGEESWQCNQDCLIRQRKNVRFTRGKGQPEWEAEVDLKGNRPYGEGACWDVEYGGEGGQWEKDEGSRGNHHVASVPDDRHAKQDVSNQPAAECGPVKRWEADQGRRSVSALRRNRKSLHYITLRLLSKATYKIREIKKNPINFWVLKWSSCSCALGVE